MLAGVVVASVLSQQVVGEGSAGPVSSWTANANAFEDSLQKRLLQLHNGDWLSETARTNLSNTVHISRSTDGAVSWQSISTVTDANRVLAQPHLIQRPDGSVILSAAAWNGKDPYAILTWRSTNDGTTWGTGPLSTVDSFPAIPNEMKGLWEPHLFNLADGRLAALYANEGHAYSFPSYSQVISERVSNDGGASWGPEFFVAATPGTSRPGVPVVAKRSDGQFVLAYEVCGAPGEVCPTWTKVSADGVTWDVDVYSGRPVTGHAYSTHIASLADGRLVISSARNEVSYSNDFGETWLRQDPPAFSFAQGDPSDYLVANAL